MLLPVAGRPPPPRLVDTHVAQARVLVGQGAAVGAAYLARADHRTRLRLYTLLLLRHLRILFHPTILEPLIFFTMFHSKAASETLADHLAGMLVNVEVPLEEQCAPTLTSSI